MRAVTCLGATFMLAAPVLAHHSVVGLYDPNRVTEIEGVIRSVAWRNPHTEYIVEVVEATGETVEWTVEGGSLSLLRTRGFEPGFVQPGERVRLAGDASRRGLPEMFAHNMLLENGLEALLTVRAQPRWSAALLQPQYDAAAAEQAGRTADGIFRVWSTVLGDPASFPMFKGEYPALTERAEAIHAQWDPRSSPFLGCAPKGIPNIMDTPLAIEFARLGDDIVLNLEEHDTQRRIHMTPNDAQPPASYSPLGYSTGRWEGRELVVETTRIDTPYMTIDGIPQSRAIRLTERFVMNASADRLDYTITITDPETFTEPFQLQRYLIWKPEMQLGAFECEQ